MKCPKCGTEVSIAGCAYDLRRGCPVCGWTRAPGDQPVQPEGEFSVSPGQLVVCWILAIPMVLGPYVAVWWFRPAWATEAFPWKYYWLAWGIYLLIAFLFAPEPDVDQPLLLQVFWPTVATNEWYWNRFMVFLALALTPGKIVLAALLGIPRYVFLIRRLRAKNRQVERGMRARLPQKR